MDAPMTDGREAELADLRRRAYGPDADIGRDAAATARLHELESLLRPSRPDSPGTEEGPFRRAPAAEPADPEPTGPDPTGPELRGRSTAPDGGSSISETDEARHPAARGEDESRIEAGAAAPAEPTIRPAWWRRRGVRIGAISAVAGLALGIGIPLVATPRPAAVLGVVDHGGGFDTSDAAEGSIIEYLNLKAKSLRRLESYGNIQGWIGASNDGSTCLLLTPADPSSDLYFYGASCTPPGMDWVVDVRITDDTQDLHLPGEAPRIGSVLRFQGHGDSVELWIAEAPPAGA